MASPLVPTLAVQAATVVCLVIAGAAGRAAGPRHPGAATLAVLALLTSGGLILVLIYRMSR